MRYFIFINVPSYRLAMAKISFLFRRSLISSMTDVGHTNLNLYLSDGGSITWFEPPPFATVTEPFIISAANKSLIKGSPNEELSCNFSLTADLRIITVSMKFGGRAAVTLVEKRQAPSVDPIFASRLNATWYLNKLTLILFNVTDAEEGEYRCEVISFGRSAQTWVRTIQVSLLGKIRSPYTRF